jgi:hypothetical protein
MNDAVGEAVNRILGENRIGLAEAGRRGGRSTRRRCSAGPRAADGTRVKLEAIRVGSRLITSREAVARFVARLSAAPGAAPAPRSPAERRKAAEKAGEELDTLLGTAGGKGVPND